jgi:transcriptional repressor NrdR
MNELSKIDQVAYVRFASVYKDFNNAADFEEFIHRKLGNK